MEEFRRQFLLEAVITLENLLKEFQTAESFSDSRKTEIFRTLHTVKGTSQTFGFQTSSRLAHHLESLLTKLNTQNFLTDINSKDVFLEGVAHLIESFKQKDFQIPDSYHQKIQAVENDSNSSFANEWNNFLSDIPEVFLSQLTLSEKNNLRSALENGKNLYCLEVEFDLTSFADQLINIRENLDAVGEIIATLPGANAKTDGKIGFRILLTSSAARSEIDGIGDQSAAQIIFDSTQTDFSLNLQAVSAQIVKHGKMVAAVLGKQIEINISTADFIIAPDKLKIIFDMLLHLVRNSVDHAFESKGNITINLKSENNQAHLIFTDNGRGVDLQEVKQKALEKNLVGADESLTDKETIDLIFLSEFSTKNEISEISGRGVGLDAVKSIVEKNGGQITVKNQQRKGLTFEIYLPL